LTVDIRNKITFNESRPVLKALGFDKIFREESPDDSSLASIFSIIREATVYAFDRISAEYPVRNCSSLELDAHKIRYVTMANLSSYNMTTLQRVANDDAVSVGGDTFHIVTTHFDVSQRNQAITEDKQLLQRNQDDCGTFFMFC
jgi:hypothetical protein